MTDADVRMVREIMRGLLGKYEDKDVTGWELWNDFVEDRIRVGSYERYKRIMRELENAGRIRLDRPPNVRSKMVSLARSFVVVTEAGLDWWDDMRGGTILGQESSGVDATSLEEYIGKRVKKVIPRAQWGELMRMVKAGELEIAFLRPKN